MVELEPNQLPSAEKGPPRSTGGRQGTAMTDINFDKIRTYQDTRYGGFEELCCQLARLEMPHAVAFHRKGPGADAGVECFAVMADSSEIGWQTKFFKDEFGRTQIQQLDESIEHALAKHPKLTRYIVCIPKNLRDASQKSKTELGWWTEWVSKWEAKASDRSLKIEKWDNAYLGLLLGKDDPNYTGRLSFWFDEERLSSAWFKLYFEKTKVVLGARYTPETNVELPLRKTLTYFSRDVAVRRAVDRWISAFKTAARDLIQHQPYEPAQTPIPRPYRLVDARFRKLIAGLSQPIDETTHFDVAQWLKDIEKCRAAIRLTRRWIWTVPEQKAKPHGGSARDYAMHYLLKLMDVVSEIEKEFAARDWQYINERELLIDGPAGIGKSHLLADAVEHSLDRGQPALIVAGNTFTPGEPWRQILQYVDYPPTKQLKDFLGALDACAEAARSRAVIYVDALNEHHGTEIWPHHLAAFLFEAKKFKRIAIVLSCRTTYVRKTVPANVAKTLRVITHQGFKGHAAVAAQKYLNMRGISLASTPNLAPEFTNPLFLKTCCDFLKAAKQTEFPKGLRGVNTIFDFYLAAVCSEMETRMGLDQNNIPRLALEEFTKLCIEAKSGHVPKATVREAFKNIHDSQNMLKRSLLANFESEGILTVEPSATGGTDSETVRYTFERLSDYAIANHLMREHMDSTAPAEAFKPGTVLHGLLHSDKSNALGIVEAIAVLLPEQTDLELPEVMSGGYQTNAYMRVAFLNSLPLRTQSRFSDKTFDWVQKLFKEEKRRDIWISLATEPENKFNANWLHSKLLALPLPERDQAWTVYINGASEDESSSISTLIEWLREGGLEHLEDDRADLAATMISWMFTASNRFARDQATKALSRLLRKRLHLSVQLLERFIGVNDPYVLERVIAGIYGAALQGADTKHLSVVSEAIYKLVFAAGTPPVNILTRDYARGVIEYTHRRGKLPSTIDLAKCRPPYASPWVENIITEADMSGYVQTFRTGHTSRDEIVGSVINDGDFARYVVDRTIRHWNPAPIGAAQLLTDYEVFDAWIEDFQKNGTTASHEALIELIELVQSLESSSYHRPTEDDAAIKAAELKLQATMTVEQWSRFRAEAQLRVRNWGSYSQPHKAEINTRWARHWVCKRAHDLGWTNQRFGMYDSQFITHDRHSHRRERIGKKYQWIALYELAAQLADNRRYSGRDWGKEKTEYEGPWDYPSLRNIDVSLLASRTHYDGWREWDKTWWVPTEVVFSDLTPEEQVVWLDLDRDKVNDESLIDLLDPKSGKRWLSIDGHMRWSTKSSSDDTASSSRDVWFRLDCRAVKKADFKSAIESLSGTSLTDPGNMREDSFSGSERFLGEYPWHPSFDEFHEEEGAFKSRSGINFYPTIANYSCEEGSYDHSLESNISFKVPSTWLMNLMRLRLADGDTLEYLDNKGEVIFFDPCVRKPGSSAGVVAREPFLKALDKAGFVPIWIVAGEKNVYGASHSHSSFGGRRLITRIYWLEGGIFKHVEYIEPSYPSKSQLKNFLGKEPPSHFNTRVDVPIEKPDASASKAYEDLLAEFEATRVSQSTNDALEGAKIHLVKAVAEVRRKLALEKAPAATTNDVQRETRKAVREGLPRATPKVKKIAKAALKAKSTKKAGKAAAKKAIKKKASRVPAAGKAKA